jgi:hypothetical protein
MAVLRGYDFVLDKSEGITIIFADPKLDKSEDVLKDWGYKELKCQGILLKKTKESNLIFYQLISRKEIITHEKIASVYGGPRCYGFCRRFRSKQSRLYPDQ